MNFTMELLAPAEQTWVPAEEFQPGDSLKSLNGLRQITNRHLERTTERVYNIEVEGDHVYRIGENGLLVHNASEGDIDSPKGRKNCCPTITEATKSVFRLENKLKKKNFIWGELNSGKLEFVIENLPKDRTGCPGPWMFGLMMEHFGSNVTSVVGFWTYGDNFDKVNELTAGGAMTVEKAAEETWTGINLKPYNFTQIEKVATSGSPGNYTKIHVLFKKPS